MMKKLIVLFLTFFLLNVNVINVSAASACDYSEQTDLNSKAANIKVSYEIVEDKKTFEDGDTKIKVFNIQILNLTDTFYIVVKNDISEDEITYYATDAVDGVISFKWDYAETVTNFTFLVYTSNSTGCPDEKYKTIYLTTPRYNEFYNIESCQELTDFYLCQEFVTFSEISRSEFINQIQTYRDSISNNDDDVQDSDENTIFDKAFSFVNKNKWYIIVGSVVIIAGGYLIYRIKTKKQRELGL